MDLLSCSGNFLTSDGKSLLRDLHQFGLRVVKLHVVHDPEANEGDSRAVDEKVKNFHHDLHD
eukprot:SAG11_NODE_1662_length_4497_cov_2.281492_7_plen_62_part_00